MKKLKELWELFFTFFKIGLFTFGGGYAMISLIEDECVEKHPWMTHEEMADMLAIAESTPGPISINCATHIGYRQKGFFGAMMTTLGVVLPSFIIILLIANFFDYILEIPLIAAAFRGIAVAVSLLILRVGIKLLRKADRPLPSRASYWRLFNGSRDAYLFAFDLHRLPDSRWGAPRLPCDLLTEEGQYG